jgi:hypothetical protein
MEKKNISKFMEEIKKNNEKINQFLIDNSFTTLYAASNIGNIHRLDLKKESYIPPILGKCNEILCFDNCQDYIVAGHSNGYISIIFKGFTIETILDEKKSPIIAIKIIKFLKKKNKEKIEFLYSNKEGQINLIIRAKGIFNKKKCVNILQNSSPIYNIISYNPDQDLSLSKKKRMYFGFVGINNLIFMKIKPLPLNEEERNKLIVNIIKPDIVKEEDVADCCLGLGYIPGNRPKSLRMSRESSILDVSKLHPLLLISWGKIIFLYYEKMDNNGIKKYKLNSVYIHSNPILRITYLTDSCISIIDSLNVVKIIYTYNFDLNINDLNKPTIVHEDYIFNPFQLDSIKYKEFSYNNKVKKIYCNYIVPFQHENKGLIIFDNDNITFLNLSTYQNITTQLAEKGEFEQMLWFGKIIFINPKQALSLGNESEGEFLSEYKNNLCVALFFKAYSFVLSKNDQTSLNLLIRELIEFSMETETSSALFNFFDSILINDNNKQIIFDIYTKYMLELDQANIMLNEGISENFLLNYIDYYIKKNMRIELSKVLLKIDYSILKKEKIEGKIIDNELVNTYIYISMNSAFSDESNLDLKKEEYSSKYFKPIEYILGLLNTKKNLPNEKYRDFIIFQQYKYDLNEIYICKEYFTHKVLWYCNYCFDQKLYPYNFVMDYNSFSILVKKITLFLTSKETMNLFLDFDSYSYFNVLGRVYLEENLVQIINSEFDNEELDDFIYTIRGENMDERNLSAKNLLYEVINYSKSKNNIFIKKDLYDFVAMISKNMITYNLFMDKIILTDACEFLLNYPKEILIHKEIDPFNCHKCINDKEFKEEKQLNEEKIKEIIFAVKDLDFEENDYDILLNASKSSPYDEITLMLLNISHKYGESLEFQIQRKESNKMYIFDWIDETLHHTHFLDKKIINKGKDFEMNFKTKLLEKLKDLAKINQKKVSELIDRYFEDQQETVIQQFEQTPELQFQYVEKYLENHGNREIEYADEFKYFVLKKIQLLVKLEHKGEVLNTLRKYYFVCNQNLLNFFENNDLKDCLIYTYCKMGNIQEGIEKIKEENQTNLNYILDNINSIKFSIKFIDWLIDKIKRYIELGIEACHIISNNSDSLGNYWEQLLNVLYLMRNNYKEFKIEGESTIDKEIYVKKIGNMIEENIQNVLVAMSEYYPILSIINLVNDNCKDASMKEFTGIIGQLFNNQRILEVICNSAKILIGNAVFKDIKKFYHYRINGRNFEPKKCDYCGRDIGKEKIILFGCNHYYHVRCCAEERKNHVCYICKTNEIEESLTYVENNMLLAEDKEIEFNEEKEESEVDIQYIKQKTNEMRRILKLETLKRMKKHHLVLENLVNDMEIIESGIKNKLRGIQIGN